MAEYYGILDWQRVPVATLGALIAGLGADSRLGMEISDLRVKPDTLILAQIHDLVSMLWWAQTEDAQKNRNRPKMLTEFLLGKDKNEDTEAFADSEEFEKARAEILNKVKENENG